MHILSFNLAHIRSLIRILPTDHQMAKRSRIVSTLDTPSSSPSPDILTTTSTNHNARRLAQAHTVTLRSNRSRRTNRQTQQALHTAVEQDTAVLSDNDSSQHLNDDHDHLDVAVDSQVESDDDVPDIPKRPAVRSLTMFGIKKNSSTPLHSLDHVKNGYLIVESISTRCSVTTAWERPTSY